VGQFPETASVHYISDGGRVRIGRTEAWDREVNVIEKVEKLGTKLKLHTLVDGEVFENRHIDIEEAWIRQQVTGRVTEGADCVDGEKRGVEVLIHHLSV